MSCMREVMNNSRNKYENVRRIHIHELNAHIKMHAEFKTHKSKLNILEWTQHLCLFGI